MVHRRTSLQGPAFFAVLCVLLFCSLSALAESTGASFVANATLAPGDDTAEETLDNKTISPPPSDRVQAAIDASHTSLAEEFINRPTHKKQQPVVGGLSLGRAAIALALVLALIVVVSVLFRRFNPAARTLGRGGCMQVLLRTSISAKQSLCLVKVSNRLLLLGLSPNHIAALDTIDDPDDVAQIIGMVESRKPNSIAGTFRSTIDNEIETYDSIAPAGQETDDTSGRDGQYAHAQGELTTLLDKVKGLSRIHFRS